jgi:hypothetical protein
MGKSQTPQHRPQTPQRRSQAPDKVENPHAFARRLKRWAVVAATVAFGLTWGLVSQNVVGATNATTTKGVTIPGSEYFGSAGSQPVPIIGSSTPVVRSGAS